MTESIALPPVHGVGIGSIVTVVTSDREIHTYRVTGTSELGMDLELDPEPTGPNSGLVVTLSFNVDPEVADAETAHRKAERLLARWRDPGVDGTPLKTGGSYWPIGSWPEPPAYRESMTEFWATQARFIQDTLGGEFTVERTELDSGVVRESYRWTPPDPAQPPVQLGSLDDLPPPEPGSAMDEAYRRTLRKKRLAGIPMVTAEEWDAHLTRKEREEFRRERENRLLRWDELPDELVPQHAPEAPDDLDSALCEKCGRSIWNTQLHHLRKGGPRA